MTRELLDLRTDGKYGSVALAGDEATFDGLAADVFRRQRNERGDLAAARELMKYGWSNGQTLYLGDQKS